MLTVLLILEPVKIKNTMRMGARSKLVVIFTRFQMRIVFNFIARNHRNTHPMCGMFTQMSTMIKSMIDQIATLNQARRMGFYSFYFEEEITPQFIE